MDMAVFFSMRRAICRHLCADKEDAPDSSQHSFYLGHELNVLLGADIRGQAYAIYNSLVEEDERLDPMDKNRVLSRPSIMADSFRLVLKSKMGSIAECSDPKLLAAFAAFNFSRSLR